MALVDDDGTNNAASLQLSVQDVAPTVGFSGATSVDEASHYSITVGPVFDPGADVITQLIIHWGDGSPNLFSQNPGDATHTYADGTTNPVITVDVLDDDGLHLNAGSFGLTVNNVAPTVSLGGPSEVDEGSLYTLSVGNVVDPGSETISAYLIDRNDGTNPQNIPVASLPASREVTHTFANGPATPTIRVDLFDEDGTPHVGAGSQSLTVNDVAPTISLSGAESINEGSLYTLTLGDVIDPGTSDAVTSYVVSWGDGNSDRFNTSSLAVATHPCADGPASHAITVNLVDNDGTHTVPVDIEVSVENLAPTVVITGAAVIPEGDLYTLSLEPVVDPGADTI